MEFSKNAKMNFSVFEKENFQEPNVLCYTCHDPRSLLLIYVTQVDVTGSSLFLLFVLGLVLPTTKNWNTVSSSLMFDKAKDNFEYPVQPVYV